MRSTPQVSRRIVTPAHSMHDTSCSPHLRELTLRASPIDDCWRLPSSMRHTHPSFGVLSDTYTGQYKLRYELGLRRRGG
jgi:hypothetical protein